MKRAAISLATLAFALAMAWPVQAQTDFSGTWKLNAEKSEMGGGGGRGGGMMAEMVVTQSATELSVTRGEQTVVYKLDGSETTVPGGRGGAATAKARAEGATIVIETTRMMNDQAMTTKATWAMVDGALVVTNSSPRGETKMVYEKQ